MTQPDKLWKYIETLSKLQSDTENTMTEGRKDTLVLALLLVLLILFFSKILFTDQIIRAPDILNEFYWTMKDSFHANLLQTLKLPLFANWDIYSNSGDTTEGGWVAGHFLIQNKLIFNLIPPPASIAWFMVLHFFLGGVGTYFYCRTIGASRHASFFGGLIFALATENVSLINAGHVLKVATISFAPLSFYLFEKGFLTRRIIYFLATALVLALQFFEGHWQISFYTCLAIGVYGLLRSAGMLLAAKPEERKALFPRIVTFNLVLLLFFLSTVSIALLPLANWSQGTNRGAQSGANQGKGGLQQEEAMTWSLPPEELATFVIPGFFGLSRQEGGANPTNIPSYYWGRMNFTQTSDYMGLLPWLLAPLPLIFRRDRYTWLAVAGIAGGLFFSMGKYTPFYQFLFDHFPGINRFRVPKMMMIIPLMSLGVLTARGIDLLLDDGVRQSTGFRRYLAGLLAVPILLLVLLGVELAGRDYWLTRFIEFIAQPTRYEQGQQLVMQRWNNIVTETAIAAAVATIYVMAILAYSRRWLGVKLLPVLLLMLYVADLGRVNAKFMFLVDPPHKPKAEKTPLQNFLLKDSKEYRALSMAGDPMPLAAVEIPVLFTSRPVQQVRWQDYLDNLVLASPMVDILNLKYLIVPLAQYQQEKAQFSAKYMPVFQTPDGAEIVLQNRTVLPKGWLVTSVVTVSEPRQALAIIQGSSFDPRQVAVVESPPPLLMLPPGSQTAANPGDVRLTRFEGERIELSVSNTTNALLVIGEKYYRGWRAKVDGKETDIQKVNYLLRGVYLPPGTHQVSFVFDPLPFKIGKFLTLGSMTFFMLMLVREVLQRRKSRSV